MDTIEQTNEPSEVEGATSPADTSSFDTQPAESTDSVSDGTVDEAVEAPLLAGKYKSPQELEKAYSELQSKLGEQGQKAELANLLEQQTGMTADQIKSYLAQQQMQAHQQQIQDNPGLAAYQELQQLKSQMALNQEQQELDKFLNSEEGKAYQPFKDKILNLGLNLEKEKSYDDIAREYFGNARAQGQQDAYRKIETKVMTQATGSSKAPSKGRISEEEMKQMSTKDMEQFLPRA